MEKRDDGSLESVKIDSGEGRDAVSWVCQEWEDLYEKERGRNTGMGGSGIPVSRDGSRLFTQWGSQVSAESQTAGYDYGMELLSLIHISEPTRQAEISYAVFCLKKKKQKKYKKKKKKKDSVK